MIEKKQNKHLGEYNQENLIKNKKEENYIESINYAMDIGYVQYKDRKTKDLSDYFELNPDDYALADGTRTYNFDSLKVDLTLPYGEQNDFMVITESILKRGHQNI